MTLTEQCQRINKSSASQLSPWSSLGSCGHHLIFYAKSCGWIQVGLLWRTCKKCIYLFPGNLGTKYEWKEAGCRLAATLHAPRQFIVIYPFLANSHDHGQFYSSLFFPELIVATTDGRRVGGFRKRRVEMRKWNPLIIFSSWEIVAKTGDISII